MTVRFARHVATLVAILVLAAGTLAAAPTDAEAFAPASQATVHPGVQTVTGVGQCTANFVFSDGTDLYLGQAAHCAAADGALGGVNGCLTESLPLGTSVDVAGADHPGSLAYSSWLTMQEVGEDDFTVCMFNDFALVKLDPADHATVNPSVPFFGGPRGLNTTGTALGEPVYSYGNSMFRLGLQPLSPKLGVSLGSAHGGWSHPVYTVTPGIPGDSGSAFLDSSGNALGVLSTLMVAPLIGSNGVSDLQRALAYLRTHTGLDVRLVPGTEPFSPL